MRKRLPSKADARYSPGHRIKERWQNTGVPLFYLSDGFDAYPPRYAFLMASLSASSLPVPDRAMVPDSST